MKFIKVKSEEPTPVEDWSEKKRGESEEKNDVMEGGCGSYLVESSHVPMVEKVLDGERSLMNTMNPLQFCSPFHELENTPVLPDVEVNKLDLSQTEPGWSVEEAGWYQASFVRGSQLDGVLKDHGSEEKNVMEGGRGGHLVKSSHVKMVEKALDGDRSLMDSMNPLQFCSPFHELENTPGLPDVEVKKLDLSQTEPGWSEEEEKVVPAGTFLVVEQLPRMAKMEWEVVMEDEEEDIDPGDRILEVQARVVGIGVNKKKKAAAGITEPKNIPTDIDYEIVQVRLNVSKV